MSRRTLRVTIVLLSLCTLTRWAVLAPAVRKVHYLIEAQLTAERGFLLDMQIKPKTDPFDARGDFRDLETRLNALQSWFLADIFDVGAVAKAFNELQVAAVVLWTQDSRWHAAYNDYDKTAGRLQLRLQLLHDDNAYSDYDAYASRLQLRLARLCHNIKLTEAAFGVDLVVLTLILITLLRR